jgi:hypothetical protein
MTGVAQLTGLRSLLFPEGVALAWGAWAMGRGDWCRLGPRLVLAPVLCAACGLAAAILLPFRLAAELAALSAAFVVLAALRAWVGPALSAAVLPAVAGIHSWAYVLSVATITAVIGGGILIRDRRPVPSQSPAPRPSAPAARAASPARMLMTWAIAAAWLAIAAGLALPLAASAPPLLVAAFEWINGQGRRDAREGIRVTAALTVTWTIGAVIAWHVPSITAAGTASLLAAAAVIGVARVTFAPLLAIALVPLVLGAPATPAGVLEGTCAVTLAVAVLFLSGSLARMSPGATWLRRIIARANTRSQQ